MSARWLEECERADTSAEPWVKVTPVSEVPERAVGWLWQGRIPRAMLTMLEGDGGTGKSTLLLDLAARVSRGNPMPDETQGGEPGTVGLLSAEDDPSAVIRPRLKAAGADLERIILPSIRDRDSEREPNISEADIAILEQTVRDEGAVLLIVDPLVAYLPDAVDTNSDHSVRRALVRLKRLAESTGCAVICVRHWRKGASENALYRGGGSVGFINAARAGLVVGNDPGDETKQKRLLAVSKMNLAPIPPTLEFRLVVQPGATTPRIAWGGISKHSANALAAPRQDQSKVDEAGAFLDEKLADGAMRAEIIERMATEEDIAPASLRRARERRGITRKRGNVHKVLEQDGSTHWYWKLPGMDAQTAHVHENEHLPIGGGLLSEHLRGEVRP